jgi:uncharacterized protein YccT (UPF0319 family)
MYEGEDIPADQLATVRVPVHMDLVSVDEKQMSITSSFLRTGDLLLELAPGPHTLVVRYHDIWDVTEEYHETIKSPPATLSFQAAPGGAYLIAMKDPKDMASAQLFATSFHPWIEDEKTGRKLDALPSPPPETPAGPDEAQAALPAEAPAEPAEEQAALPADTSAGPDREAAAPPPESPAEPAPAIRMDEDVSALKMLQFWWQRASKEGKVGFMEWIVAAPPPGEGQTDLPMTDEQDVSALEMLKYWWGKAGIEERKVFMEGLVDR